ncbi:hypothetical protein HGRIS_008947 [Hohenbuehelia grisea]|uniref:Uncharacterized protein n=1 Tax=Hohenbuehelia grisea TaxID=104357 RepID=A0ABR3IZN6_9AGAR
MLEHALPGTVVEVMFVLKRYNMKDHDTVNADVQQIVVLHVVLSTTEPSGGSPGTHAETPGTSAAQSSGTVALSSTPNEVVGANITTPQHPVDVVPASVPANVQDGGTANPPVNDVILLDNPPNQHADNNIQASAQIGNSLHTPLPSSLPLIYPDQTANPQGDLANSNVSPPPDIAIAGSPADPGPLQVAEIAIRHTRKRAAEEAERGGKRARASIPNGQ